MKDALALDAKLVPLYKHMAAYGDEVRPSSPALPAPAEQKQEQQLLL